MRIFNKSLSQRTLIYTQIKTQKRHSEMKTPLKDTSYKEQNVKARSKSNTMYYMLYYTSFEFTLFLNTVTQLYLHKSRCKQTYCLGKRCKQILTLICFTKRRMHIVSYLSRAKFKQLYQLRKYLDLVYSITALFTPAIPLQEIRLQGKTQFHFIYQVRNTRLT